MIRFENREEAGKSLAEKLLPYKDQSPRILAIYSGGVPVAYEIATRLKAPLDALFLEKTASGEIQESSHLAKKFHGTSLKSMIKDQVVLLVDEGMVSGSTMKTAIEFVKHKNPRKLILAIPAGARPVVESLRKLADEVVCLETPEHLTALGTWYKNLDPVSDEDINKILREARYLHEQKTEEIEFKDGEQTIKGNLSEFPGMKALVIFAHGTGSNRLSPRNQYVATEFNKMGLGTLLIDLLTDEESALPKNDFDVQLQAKRLLLATEWARQRYQNNKIPLAYFGSSTGAGAALMAAGQNIHDIYAIVSRGGRPDLAGEYLSKVSAPTLLIVGAADTTMLSHNREAQKKMTYAKMVLIPKAGPLFEEEGALEEVVEYSSDWLLENIPAKKSVLSPKENIVHELRSRAQPIKDTHSWDKLIEKVSNSRVVMLGEATHGTAEFYNIRRYISERLIKDHGFNFIAVEGDWPDCQHLNDYIQSGNGQSASAIMRQFQRWPTWMWANEETATLIEWMKNFKTGFYGLDVYSLFESMDIVKSFCEKVDPELARSVREHYACFDPFARDEKAYARHLTKFPEGCRKDVLANLKQVLRLRMDEAANKFPDLLNAQQNARIVANAESYYHAMLFGGAESWNVRDKHMIDTLEMLLRRTGSNSKCIVWAHNSHIGDYHATDMLQEGYINLGGLARERLGADQVSLIGFGTYSGQVLAGPAWDGPEMVTPLPPARESSLEYFCHKTAEDLAAKRFYVLFDSEARKGILGTRSYGHRAVGVVYRPQFEERGHNYVPTIPAQRYDAFVFVDKTSALKSLRTMPTKLDLPETWPGGL